MKDNIIIIKVNIFTKVGFVDKLGIIIGNIVKNS